jgi:hypothetical protein
MYQVMVTTMTPVALNVTVLNFEYEEEADNAVQVINKKSSLFSSGGMGPSVNRYAERLNVEI